MAIILLYLICMTDHRLKGLFVYQEHVRAEWDFLRYDVLPLEADMRVTKKGKNTGIR